MEKNQSLATRWSENRPLNLGSFNDDTGSISIYDRGEVTPDRMLIEIARLKAAFPSLPSGFFDVLRERIIDHKFSNEKLHDAVNFVIDNCRYPIPSVADIINYDKKIKYYSYEEIIKKAIEFGKEIWEQYKPIKLYDNAKPLWVNVDDIKKYNLK